MKLRLLFAAAALTAATGLLAAQPDISLDASISKTSLWPGDRFHYRITLTVPEGVKVALEDFEEESVNFDPFVLVERHLESGEAAGGGVRHEFDYLLANYEIGDQLLEIPALIFRYERGSVETNTPTTEEKRIPPLPISVRSTQNQPLQRTWIRESLLAQAAPSRNLGILFLGLAGLLMSSFPLAAEIWRRIPDWQARRSRLTRKKFLSEIADSIGLIEKSSGPESEVKSRYQSLEDLVRRYAEYFWEMQIGGLTADELSNKLDQADARHQVLVQIVEHGQECRYSPSGEGRWDALLREDLQRLKALCTDRP